MHQSEAIIDSVQIIPLGQSDLSPFIDKVKIKVFYLGRNRNGSYIDKETALEMSKTLRGCPIVGKFREEKEDYTDHGEEVTFDDRGITIECTTKPYGFVDLNAEVWFEKYNDIDEFGNQVQRTYLVTTGVVWSGQYPEVKAVLEENGRPQSMELDEETIEGHWAEDVKTNKEFFIINDAIFSKLCILGEDVEPCFEGSSITSSEVSSTFSFEGDDFKQNLLTMMKEFKELTFSLQSKGGKEEMKDQNKDAQKIDEYVVLDSGEAEANQPAEEESKAAAEEPANETEVENKEKNSSNKDKKSKNKSKNFENNIEVSEESESEEEVETEVEDVESAEEVEVETDFEKKEEEDSKEKAEESDEEDEEKKKSKNFTEEESLEAKYSALQKDYEKISALYELEVEKNKELTSFKEKVEEEAKDNLIDSFYMLSDEDKKDVIENKSKYSLDDIEKELSVICVRKKVSFDTETKTEKEKAVYTYNVEEVQNDLPEWLKAVENNKANK